MWNCVERRTKNEKKMSKRTERGGGVRETDSLNKELPLREEGAVLHAGRGKIK